MRELVGRGGRGARRLAEGGVDRCGVGRVGGLGKGIGWAERGVVGLGRWAEGSGGGGAVGRGSWWEEGGRGARRLAEGGVDRGGVSRVGGWAKRWAGQRGVAGEGVWGVKQRGWVA